LKNLLEKISNDLHTYKVIYNGKMLTTVKFVNGSIKVLNENISFNINKDFSKLFQLSEVRTLEDALDSTFGIEELNISSDYYDFALSTYNRVIVITKKCLLEQNTSKSEFVKFVTRYHFLYSFLNYQNNMGNTYFNGNPMLQFKKIEDLKNDFFVIPNRIGNLNIFNFKYDADINDYVLFKNDKEFCKIKPFNYSPNINYIGDFDGVYSFRKNNLSLIREVKNLSEIEEELALIIANIQFIDFEEVYDFTLILTKIFNIFLEDRMESMNSVGFLHYLYLQLLTNVALNKLTLDNKGEIILDTIKVLNTNTDDK